MKLFSKILLITVATAVLSWFLPWIYTLIFPTPSGEPFCSFSPVNNRWIVSRSAPGEKTVIMVVDSAGVVGAPQGTIITKTQRDSLVPQLFYKELMAHNKLPDTIGGKEVNAHELRTHELMLTNSPRDEVKRMPGVWLMMESMPERVELSDPSEVFRFTANGIEFIDMASNTVNESRSRRFTETMTQRAFCFPATDLSANVTSRKNYDEGYLMIDAEGKLFHVKQRAGRPYVAAIPMPANTRAYKAFITEDMERSTLGFVVDTDQNFYIIRHTDGYNVLPLPVGKVNPDKESILAMGNLFNITFRFSANGQSRWVAVQPDIAEDGTYVYRLLGNYTYVQPRTKSSLVSGYIFPFTLSFTSTTDSLAYPRIGKVSIYALYLNVLLALCMIFIGRKRHGGYFDLTGAAVTLVCGIFSFIPFALLDH